MSNLARNMMWGLMGATTTKVARRATRRALHDPVGAPRLPRTARRKSGLGMTLAWAAGAGVALALADVLREQKKETTHRA
ncbi:MAG TPA: hypothetical protein VF263_00845 [Longimicrobiaceae bacterium]